jgi:conjugative coupling factor TraD (TOL family)
MAQPHAVEVLLRPAVELYTVAVCAGAALLCLVAPWSLALNPLLGLGTALAFLTFGAVRLHDAWAILRYRRNIRRLPRYVMISRDVPVSQQRLFIGRGFKWEQRHTHRLMQTYRPEFRRFVEPTAIYRAARRMEERLEFAPFPLSKLARVLAWDSPFNPARPLPPVGGQPRLHGIEPHETDVTLPLGERVGHSLVLGTTRVGKTRLAELFITQDIRRRNAAGEYEVVIVFDPKGDADLLKRMYVEAKRAGREGEFYVFHLGWPDISARYNAVGRFGRISEVATRIAGQLSGEGNSAAFREFAWRFVNIIARALVELGQRPDYLLIQRHVINIDALFIEYAQHYFAKNEPKAWEVIVQLEARLNDKNIPRNMIGREKRVVALEQYLSQVRVYDPVLDGLRSAVRYDRTYFDKIVASLLPLLEKLTTGKIAQLLAPNYSDLSDPRPIFDWMQIIRKRAVVYVGLDALSDAEVAAAVGNSMFSDLVSVAGHIYKFGIDDGLPGSATGVKVPINVHADEFNELMGDEFIPMVNKGGGARRAGDGLHADAQRHRGAHRQPRQGRPGDRQLQQPLHVEGKGDRHRRTADAATAQGRCPCHRDHERRHRQLRSARQHRLHVQHPGPHQHDQCAADRARTCGGLAQGAVLRADRGRHALEGAHALAGPRPRRGHAPGSAAAGRLHAPALRRGRRLVGEPEPCPACRMARCPTTCWTTSSRWRPSLKRAEA